MDEIRSFYKILFGDLLKDEHKKYWLTVNGIEKRKGLKDKVYTSWINIDDEQAFIDASENYALSLRFDTYAGLGVRKQKMQEFERGSAEHVNMLPGIWIEVDYGEVGHAAKDLPPTKNEALALVNRFPLKPTLVVSSGHGIHAYWLFKEFWEFEPKTEEWEKAQQFLKDFQKTMKKYAAEKGWIIDTTKDLARILRVPGTFNYKEEPVQVETLHSDDSQRYEPNELESYFTDTQVPHSTRNTEDDPFKGLPSNFPPSDWSKVQEGCGFMKHAVEEANGLSEPNWYKALTIAARCTDGGRDGLEIAHEISAPHPGYSPHETTKKIHHALHDTGPSLCQSIAQDTGNVFCRGCRFNGKIRSPINLGANHNDPAHVKRDFTVIDGGLTEGSTAIQQQLVPLTGNPYDVIYFTNKFLNELSDSAWTILNRKNDPPRLFQRNWGVAEIRFKDEGAATIYDLSKDAFRGELAREMLWFRTVPGRRKGEPPRDEPAYPPNDVVADMMAKPHRDLPAIQGITYVPVFSRNGTIITSEGYHPETRLYYASRGLQIPEVPAKPTKQNIEKAKHLFLQELYGDFPFADEASRANAMAVTLLPFVRPMIDGPTPFHLFDAPAAGTGKTLLALMIGKIATGINIPTIAGGKNDEEWSKLLVSLLQAGPPILLFDNIAGSMDFPSLNNAATSTSFSGRILGQSRMAEVPNLSTWLFTGNNINVSGDILRRVCWIRLDAKMENPSLRTDYKQDNIGEFLGNHRPLFIWSALIIIQNWIAAGRPPGKQKMGSFEAWASTMGGILEASGIEGFLGNAETLREKGNPEMDDWRAFIDLWWESQNSLDPTVQEYFEKGARVTPLLYLARSHQLLTGNYSKGFSDLSQAHLFSGAILGKEDAIINGKKIVRRNWAKYSVWRLQDVGDPLDR